MTPSTGLIVLHQSIATAWSVCLCVALHNKCWTKSPLTIIVSVVLNKKSNFWISVIITRAIVAICLRCMAEYLVNNNFVEYLLASLPLKGF